MKILIPLLFLTLGVNANEVVYGSKSGTVETKTNDIPITVPTLESSKVIDLAAGEAIQILNVTWAGPENDPNKNRVQIKVKHGNLPQVLWQTWKSDYEHGTYNIFGNGRGNTTLTNNIMVGPCSIFVADDIGHEFPWQVSYKLIKPSAAGTTTSAPILLPPTQDAAKSWFVKLQVSSDLKAWDDVAPGQFLGSDTAQFFRIQTTEAE